MRFPYFLAVSASIPILLFSSNGFAFDASNLTERGTVVAENEQYQVRCTDGSFCGANATRAERRLGEQEAARILKRTSDVDQWLTSLGFKNPRYDIEASGKRQLYISGSRSSDDQDTCPGEAYACVNSGWTVDGVQAAGEIMFTPDYIEQTEAQKDETVAHEVMHTFIRERKTIPRNTISWLNEATAEAAATAWGVKQGHFSSDRFVPTEELALDLPFNEVKLGPNDKRAEVSYGYAKSRYLIKVGEEIGSKDAIAWLKQHESLRDDNVGGMSYLYSQNLPTEARFHTMFPKFVAEINETEGVDSDGDVATHFTNVGSFGPPLADYAKTTPLEKEVEVPPFAATPFFVEPSLVPNAPPNAVMIASFRKSASSADADADTHFVYEDQVITSGPLVRAYVPNTDQKLGFVRMVNAPLDPVGAKEHSVSLFGEMERVEFIWPDCVEAGLPFEVNTTAEVDFATIPNLDFKLPGSQNPTVKEGRKLFVSAPVQTGKQSMDITIDPPSKHGGVSRKVSLGELNVKESCLPGEPGDWCALLAAWQSDLMMENAENQTEVEAAKDARTPEGMERVMRELGMPIAPGEMREFWGEQQLGCQILYLAVTTGSYGDIDPTEMFKLPQ